jgi:hypothetical protein
MFWYHDDRDDHDLYGRDRLCISIILSLPKMMWIDMTNRERLTKRKAERV